MPPPDDLHVHFRQDEALTSAVPRTAAQFRRAVVMPNTDPPVRTVKDALAYRQTVLQAVQRGAEKFDPLMALYVSEETTTPEEVARAAEEPSVLGFKLYPKGATTNSQQGVAGIGDLDASFRAMEELGVPLMVHGEVGDPSVDAFDREAVFLEEELRPLLERRPQLRVVVEHVTTEAGVEFVKAAGGNVAGTLTAHHLLINRNNLLGGSLRPHLFCKPVAKRESSRRALMEAATSGHPRFFLGTDSAPHARGDKESSCGCAGIFTAHAALELYAEAFESAGALDNLPDFAARNGARFYGLPVNGAPPELVLSRRPWIVPDELPLRSGPRGGVVPFRAGEQISWRLSSFSDSRSSS